jgi:hypothetical protein
VEPEHIKCLKKQILRTKIALERISQTTTLEQCLEFAKEALFELEKCTAMRSLQQG